MTIAAQDDARQRVLDAVELPSLDGLTEKQVRGAVCVWDGIPLTADTAVNFGPRRKKRLNGSFDWYPRACRRCTARAAYRLLQAHASGCDRCRTDPSCPVSIAANRLMREGGL
jgi:hypothetical protein